MTGYSYYRLTAEEALAAAGGSLNGLTEQEAVKRLEEHGFNELKREKRLAWFDVFLRQFTSWLVILLIIACILSLFVGEIVDSVAIFIIVILNAFLGFFQEYKAEKAIEALKRLTEPTARVLRDGIEKKIPSRELVIGDVILVEAGDIIPGDCRIIESSNLQVDEASLTGESRPVRKNIDRLNVGVQILEQKNMVFLSTNVTYGKAKALVVATGMDAEMGKIAHSIQETKETETPLQLRFKQMSKQISMAFVVIIAIIFIVGLVFHQAPLRMMFLFSLSLAVAVVPESLPAIVTISLGLGARRLANRNMLIKKLPAVESLGSCTIICADKTGTITKSEMTAVKLFVNNKVVDVSGSGYEINGDFYADGRVLERKKIELFLRAGVLCNNSKLVLGDGRCRIFGDPTEGSLLVLARKAGLNEGYFKNNFSFIEEFSFSSERKMMSVVYKNNKSRKTEAYAKGAPDILLKKCSHIIIDGRIRRLTDELKDDILNKNNGFARNALRVLGIAYKEIHSKKYLIDDVENNLIFIGLVGMIDPPRDGVKDVIKECKDAGILVMMMTGDHALTAKAIAQQIGLYNEGDIILTGEELDELDDKELVERIEKIRVIARIMPVQKLRIVDALQNKGHIVAMTGDGVNDAPALKKADIGIVMGITGTDVSKEVSKAVLVDDNFATIVRAVGEGRNIYDKIVKSTKYLLSCNAGEVFSIFIAVLLSFPLLLLPLQILLMNLLTDNFPSLGLGFEVSDKDVMKRAPRNPKETPITKSMFWSIIVFGIIMAAGTILLFSFYKDIELAKAQTVAFTALVMFQMFAVISSRSLNLSFKEWNPFTNLWLFGAILLSLLIQLAVVYWGPLQLIFGTVALSFGDWIMIVIVALVGFAVMETSKSFLQKKAVKSSSQQPC